LPNGIRRDERAVAETIESNVRRLILGEMAVNPKYYERMSDLLDALIAERKRQALDYGVSGSTRRADKAGEQPRGADAVAAWRSTLPRSAQ
jgi:hypothetical protein